LGGDRVKKPGRGKGKDVRRKLPPKTKRRGGLQRDLKRKKKKRRLRVQRKNQKRKPFTRGSCD